MNISNKTLENIDQYLEAIKNQPADSLSRKQNFNLKPNGDIGKPKALTFGETARLSYHLNSVKSILK